MAPRTDLPIEAALGDLAAAMVAPGAAVLVAEPGAGKTTVVPLVLVEQPWCDGRVLIVEPRRVAARAAAQRMAQLLGQRPGNTVGWRMRGDTNVGATTRIEVITDGVLTRMLQNDPSLPGVSCVIFDEFHERSLDADLGLALCIDARQALRSDLRVLVMSATIDAAAVAALMDDAPIIEVAGRSFPVDLRWGAPMSPTFSAHPVAETIRLALAASKGDVLAFVPGAREIRAVERALGTPTGVDVRPLHGSLSPRAQDDALAPAAAGRRKVIVATNIAETSLTIDGVDAVVDSGWARRPMLDARRAMSALITARVSRASAAQRAGRAGRQRPGVAFRLWTEAEHALLDPHDPPEITQTDLVALAFELARWGDAEGTQLHWLDAPPAHALAGARALLESLGLVDGAGRVTAHGRAVGALPVHPRLGHAIVRGREMGFGATACTIAALLSDRDLGDDERAIDLARRVDRVRAGDRTNPAIERVRREATRLRKRAATEEADAHAIAPIGQIVALAYPDRVARARDTAGRFLMANGSGAVVDAHDHLASCEWLAVADVELSSDGGDARLRLAAPIERHEVERVVTITDEVVATWDRRARDVRVQTERRIGAIVLKASPFDDTAGAQRALLEGVRIEGLTLLPTIDGANELRARVAFCRRHLGDEWPDWSDDELVATVEVWLTSELTAHNVRRRADLRQVSVEHALRAQLPWPLGRRLDELAPTNVTTPKGQHRKIDYIGPNPTVSLRLQDAFGWRDTPRLADGRVPLTVALLSPAQRPVQITADLAGFWRGSYAQVRAEMRGRYPKHAWPEDPTTIG